MESRFKPFILIIVAVIQDSAAIDQSQMENDEIFSIPQVELKSVDPFSIRTEDRLMESNTDTCPSGCECLDFGECNWSLHAADVLTSTYKNDSIWTKEAMRLVEYTCNEDRHAVCCCGPEQLAPDLEPLPPNFNRTALLEAHAEDRWDWLKSAWNSVTNWIKNAWDWVVDKAKTLKKIETVGDVCGSYLKTLASQKESVKGNVEPLGFDIKKLTEAAKNMMQQVFNDIKTTTTGLANCISNVFSDRASLLGFQFGASSWSFTAHASALIHGEQEIGFAEEQTGRMRRMVFSGGCGGMHLDASAGFAFNIGFWRGLDDIPGASQGVGFGFDIPGTDIGPGIDLISNGNNLISVVFSFGIGVSVNPVDMSFYLCYTPEWYYFEPNKDCDAATSDWSCCNESPCGIGEGDCDKDSHCIGDWDKGGTELVCGTDNCKDFDSAWGSSVYDCCTKGCDSKKADRDCCTPSSPCLENHGDCDSNDDCSGDLICGLDTCTQLDAAWGDPTFDCCITGCIEYDKDYKGDDLYPDIPMVTSSASACGDACAIDASCKYWTWREKDDRCWLKYAKSGRASGKGLQSGVASAKDCRRCVAFEADFFGSDLDETELSFGTWQECAQHCHDHAKCQAFTYVGTEYTANKSIRKRCFLKSKIFSDAEKTYGYGLVSGNWRYKDCRGVLEHDGWNCWEACEQSRSDGSFPACDWCGTDSACCRRKWTDDNPKCYYYNVKSRKVTLGDGWKHICVNRDQKYKYYYDNLYNG